MEPQGEDFDPDGSKSPKITKIGKNWIFPNDSKNSPTSSFLGDNTAEHEFEIDPSIWSFEANQNADFTLHEDGMIELCVLQEKSTPGIKTSEGIHLPAGNYVFTVVAHSEVSSTFFPFAIDSDGVRLTPTIHIPNQEELVSVPFKLDRGGSVVFGVICHRQKVGDKCYISSLHVSRTQLSEQISKGEFYSIGHSDFIPHQRTTLEESQKGTIVRSKPVSTPGTFAVIDTTPSSIMTLYSRVSVSFPSVAFLYIADASTGEEIIRRNVIFESKDGSEFGEPTQLYSSFDVPSNTTQIRVGILFSTVTQPEEHVMTIHNFEISRFRSLDDFVDESYVLSLENETTKFSLCGRQGLRFGIDLTRWIAVDGNSAEILEDWEEYMKKPWSNLDNRLGRKAIDKPGAWGYLLTMKSIFQDAISKGHGSVAIFDDDFIISNSFDHGFSKLIEIIGEDWDVIYLGASQWLWEAHPSGELPFYNPDENTNGSFAVIYRESVFEELLSEIELMQAPFDAGALRRVVLGNSQRRSFVAYPNLVIANLEKPGIRDSRDQSEFSKRFGWDLEQFPPWFTSWSPTPTILRETENHQSEWKKRFVTGVTTIDRKEYLQQFVKDWSNTRDMGALTTLIIADDGSTDGTLEWLCEELEIPDSKIVVIRNDGLGIARQTNSIIDYVLEMETPPDSIFMCNDDIRFLKPGWDLAYFDAMTDSGFEHLVYFNSEWKKSTHSELSVRSAKISSSCSAREAMGCFYTLTPDLISRLGFFDEAAFPVRGHSHVDYTIRACREEANDPNYLYDFIDSNEYIGMVLRDGYRRTHRTLSVRQRIESSSDKALSKREQIISTEGRKFIQRGW